MNLHIIDTFRQIEEYKATNQGFSLDTWKIYADSVSPSLYLKCLDNATEYNFAEDVVPVLNDALYNHFDRVIAAHNALTEIVKFLPYKAAELFDVDIEISVIFYLGLCNGAGWATVLDNKQTILLGAEKISELSWHEADTMSDVVCHEAAHLIHFALRGNIPKPYKSIWQLYSEGFATRYSQRLYKEGYYNQNRNGWLTFCRENISSIKKEYLARINNNQSTSDFFGDWNSVMGQSDLGYFLGCEFVRLLEATLNPTDIACLSPEKVTRALYDFLGNR